VHLSGHALELRRADVTEHEPVSATGVGCYLADQDFTGLGDVGDARSEVDGLAEVIALLALDRPSVHRAVSWR